VGSESISPTAHYTGEVWRRNGLSHPALGTPEGRRAYRALEPMMALSRRLGGPTLERNLLARHRLIDHLLATAIDAGRVSQVLEIAAGLSPRGWRFASRYGERLTYVEGDLPEMAERKRGALARAGELPNLRVVDVDAMRDDGPESIPEVTATLDRGQGLAVITEGLLVYFDHAAVTGLWARIAAGLSDFAAGLYLADLRLASGNDGFAERTFIPLLSAFVRGKLHMHFADEADALAALRDAGFAEATLHPAHEHPAAGSVEERSHVRGIHVIEARTGPLP
jgi:O-methyltransferase involved in polyketide biosynthesis